MSSKWCESDIVNTAVARAVDSGRAMVVDWAPQMSVLQHPATRFFVNHCGAASMMESVYAGVPIVAMPFVNDQPYIARILVAQKAAIHLHQINSGMKGRPLGGGGTVTENPLDIFKEMKEVFGTMCNPITYQEYRSSTRKLALLVQSSLENGKSAEALQDLVNRYL